MHAMVKAGMMMDRSDFLVAARNILNDLTGRKTESSSTKKRFLLSGGLCTMPNVYGAIENAGGIVVGDDLCTGNRFYEGMVSSEGDVLTSIANRYAERTVCPAKHSGNRSRGENLVKLAKELKADGVIYIFLKFCDTHGFDYPYLKEMLEENGIPCMLYELEEQQSGDGQFETRCEAFVEML
jgi:benzoyl-CoA reductase/2-hydroxyglutaryl-CoA dehydratase subunit BcrC/BadD/HgdB